MGLYPTGEWVLARAREVTTDDSQAKAIDLDEIHTPSQDCIVPTGEVMGRAERCRCSGRYSYNKGRG